MPDHKTGEELVRNAFKPVAEGGAIKFDIGHRVRAHSVRGPQAVAIVRNRRMVA